MTTADPEASIRTHELDALAESWVTSQGVAPAACLAVGARGREGFRFRTGAAGVRSYTHLERVDPTTPFDLASVTKPIVACAAARLVKRRVLSWSTPLGALLPELSRTASADTTLELLLSHRAGLSPHGALYAPLLEGRPFDRARAFVQAADGLRPECGGTPPPGGFPPVYSDLGYMLAGEMTARAGGGALADVVAREVTSPLAVALADARTLRAESPDFLERVAPTEVVDFRGGELVGVVHDENAWALSADGLSGHAGMFGAALDVARFGAAMLDALAGRLPEFLGADDAEPLVRPRPAGTLRAGFDGRSEEGSSAGSAFGRRSFGHLGFTGTSVWCDPDADVVAVILTNRVHPTRDNVKIRQVRPALNDALFRAAEKLGG